MRKIALYINTLRHLKWIQIRYRVIYRLRQVFFSVHSYKKFTNSKLNAVVHTYLPCVVKDGLYAPVNHFTFLNLQNTFGEEVDWSYGVHGKLWQYNLQYFDYLNDENIANEIKIGLVNSFSNALLEKRVDPEPFPISIRLVNWILFYSRSGYAGEVFLSALKRQIGYLEKNIEYHLLANHLLENYFSLAISAFCLGDKVMIEKYILLIEKQLNEQVLGDGGHIEGSPMYHSLLLAKLFLLIDVVESNHYQTGRVTSLRLKAAAMTSWLKAFCNGNADYPFVNDAAPGIAVEPQTLFERAKQMGISAMVGNLAESGYRVFKHSDFSLLVDVAQIIPAYQPGHAHSDMLHFVLQYQCKPVFVDAGTATYDNNARRTYERSTAAHNTVVVNDTSQSQVWNSFRVAKRAKLTILEESGHMIKACHNGYADQYGATHCRSFYVDETGLLIKDEILGGEEKNITSVAMFHLHPEVAVLSTYADHIYLSNGMKMQFSNVHKISTGLYQYANGFNRLMDAGEIAVQFRNVLETKICIS